MSDTESAAKLSILANLVLVCTKMIVAVITGSLGLYAECIHSSFDLIGSLVSYFGIKKAKEPNDYNHHFGHEKFENLSSLIQATIIAATSIILVYSVYQNLSSPHPIQNIDLGIWLMVASIPFTYIISKHLDKVARKEGGNYCLESDSVHFMGDMASSLAVLVGLIFTKVGLPLGDPIAAIVVGIIMIYAAIKLAVTAFIIFTDISPDHETLVKIEKVISEDKRITRFHKLRARLAGSRIFVDVHIHFPHKTNIVVAHRIAHEIEKKIVQAVPKVKEVSVHMEPD